MINNIHILFNFLDSGVIGGAVQQEYVILNPDIDIENIEYYGTWDLWRSNV
jgi:hypothetical protein